METYIKGTQNEKQIISHIKSIAQYLYGPSSPQNYNNFMHRDAEVEGHEAKQFAQTSKFEPKYKEIHASRVVMPTTFSHSRSKGKKKKSIFGNFDKFYSKITEEPQKKEMTPIMAQINKNIYSRFKTETKAIGQISQTILNHEQRQQKWDDFLRRQQVWQRQKQDMLRESQMRMLTHQSPQLRKRINTVTNLKEVKADQQMTEVMKSIQKIKNKTQKLIQRLKRIDCEHSQQKKKQNKSDSRK